MESRAEFTEALAALVEYATVNANHITKKDVASYLSSAITDESMYDYIYQYLAENKIVVDGYTPSANIANTVSGESNENTKNLSDNSDKDDNFIPQDIKDTEEGQMFLDMYFDEINELEASMSPLDINQKNNLVKAAITGDKNAINTLCEAYLKTVIDVAKSYNNSGMKNSDIISVGNLGLFEAIIALQDVPSNVDEYFISKIKAAIDSAINDEINSYRTSTHITNRANMVSDATTTLAEKLGREATIEELCEYLSLPEDKVKEIMKMSLDAINVVSDNQ